MNHNMLLKSRGMPHLHAFQAHNLRNIGKGTEVVTTNKSE